jgi:hypothetical protein
VSDRPVCIMLFATIHDVIAAEKLLQRHDLWCDMMPTPRQLSSDCGMSLAVRAEDIARARELVGPEAAGLTGIYRQVQNRYVAL